MKKLLKKIKELPSYVRVFILVILFIFIGYSGFTLKVVNDYELKEEVRTVWREGLGMKNIPLPGILSHTDPDLFDYFQMGFENYLKTYESE